MLNKSFVRQHLLQQSSGAINLILPPFWLWVVLVESRSVCARPEMLADLD
jgi:hypothetical protein